ncbi:piwi domain-containing protein [Drepanopeziza brunnea f. sp. 'multigermtubi' MB_m1]|uniref:Piwi domain-containing protein n=1 Tax=Marssonina brunnea f. sp. multigermtubi (strain MB_m1) TaxID=1072389 RepID=K1WHL4_MARBU|nr:piwi domain-containing protein [Drepanopeziza brunnea f. sp. 'multigermtubi' MB_m1]EKD12356.1 piwi domain-containing protein [Drepanopeziza brunnea f. sp. 'multigermtubi' MB_m1]
MPGGVGAGRHRNGDNNGSSDNNGGNGGHNGQYHGGHPLYQNQQMSQNGGPLPSKPRSGGFDGPGDRSGNLSNMTGPSTPGANTPSAFTPGGGQRAFAPSPFPGMSANAGGTGTPSSQRGVPMQSQSQQGPPPQVAQERQNPYAGKALGYDPARPSGPVQEKTKVITNTRMELPEEAYRVRDNGDYNFESKFPLRKGNFNTTGKAIIIRVNQFKVLQWPQGHIQQYDIHIGDGAETRGKVYAAWNSRKVQDQLQKLSPNWLWDGNKIAWCLGDIPEQRILVDFNEEKNKRVRPGAPPPPEDKVFVIIRPTVKVNMSVVQAYLDGTLPTFDKSILAAINFLDHAMRQGPSETYTMIKRSFFSRGNVSTQLDNVVVAMKGVYTSIRLCDPKASMGTPSTGLALNVDVANGTFWAAQEIHQAARNYTSLPRNRALSYQVFRDNLLPVRGPNGQPTMSEDFKTLRKMTKLKFIVKHRGKGDDHKQYTIKRFTFEKGDAYAKTGAHARNTRFKYKDPKNNYALVDITVDEFFKRVYNIDLQYWWLPLVETAKAGLFPMELCTLVPNQRYNYKLSPEQTAAMIKFAVTRPRERLQSIHHGVGMLKWAEDKYLKAFGVKIDPNMSLTAARLLQNPEIQFAGAKVNPGTQGRWDLRGKKFLLSNPEPLNSWGFIIVEGACQESVVRNFANVFIQTYIGHGGKVQNKNPVIYAQAHRTNIAETIAAARIAIGNQVKAMPQILFYVLPARDSFLYERIKKNSECRFALVSQCVNVVHVVKAQPQYCSNVAMKVNAKLGGTTSKIAAPKGFFSIPTMIIGADVSHPSPGSPQASMAAVTMSFDKDCCRYAAGVQTNGHRVEMITRHNIETVVMPMVKNWVNKVGGGNPPKHIFYFRDGVSEGQYTHVLDQEVADMKNAFAYMYPGKGEHIKWTVVVCTKRHHIRFFPKEHDTQAGDRNANSLPGTLVERDITHPFEYDFYLCAHAAIQGTARPVHYHVIADEIKMPINEFQKMVYQSSYQYMRSTTPVSLFPAVYYAHLASNRARAHESNPASDGPRGGQKFEEKIQDDVALRRVNTAAHGSSQTGTSVRTEAAPLMPLGNPESVEIMTKIRTSMWYI